MRRLELELRPMPRKMTEAPNQGVPNLEVPNLEVLSSEVRKKEVLMKEGLGERLRQGEIRPERRRLLEMHLQQKDSRLRSKLDQVSPTLGQELELFQDLSVVLDLRLDPDLRPGPGPGPSASLNGSRSAERAVPSLSRTAIVCIATAPSKGVPTSSRRSKFSSPPCMLYPIAPSPRLVHHIRAT